MLTSELKRLFAAHGWNTPESKPTSQILEEQKESEKPAKRRKRKPKAVAEEKKTIDNSSANEGFVWRKKSAQPADSGVYEELKQAAEKPATRSVPTYVGILLQQADFETQFLKLITNTFSQLANQKSDVKKDEI